MHYELLIAKKMIGGRRSGVTGQSSNTIIRIAVAGIAIGMTVMILSIGIVSGFQEEVRQKVIGFGSHLQVSYYNPQNTLGIKPMAKYQPFVESIGKEPAVKNIQSYAMKSGIITANGEIQGVMSKGIDAEFDWDFFKHNLVAGEVFEFHDSISNDSVLLSKSIVNRLNLKLGEKITVSYFQDEKERKRRYIIGGIYETGMEQFDGSIMLCDMRHIQKLNGWDESQVAGYEVLLHNYSDLEQLDRIIDEHISYAFTTLKITDQFMDIFGWLELQDMNVFVILTLMILVSGINMISALLVLILERTNMIGLLKAMGARNKNISRIFLYNAAYLIFIGIIIGNVIGLSLGFLQQTFEFIKLDQSNYYVDHVPVLFNLNTIIAINVGSAAACLFMLMIPSMLVSRIDPVKTIKFN
ncbi:MAG: FtsX-like permease family protein [Salibacteraceae bacterium]